MILPFPNLLLIIHFDLSAMNNGLITAIVGYLIVFTALVLLYFVFYYMPKILKLNLKNIFQSKAKNQNEISPEEEEELSGETNAAISMALYLYMSELHDEESNIMTIEKVSKTYSPWSSKIYGLRNFSKPYNPHYRR